MNDRLQILLISPNAPPKNTAESIQVRRILVELDKLAGGTLITVTSTGSWSQPDKSLELPLKNFDTQLLDLPFHQFTARLLMSHYMKRFQIPDAMYWIPYRAGHVVRGLKKKHDIIYSRSCPLSSALLASNVQKKLGIPWVMHLSDPWAENPHGFVHPRHAKDEERCFRQASMITLTTQGQAEFYQRKYPDLAHKITVSPNMMAGEQEIATWINNNAPKPAADAPLTLVYAGTLYGSRSPETLMRGLDVLRATRPDLLDKLRIDFYGHAHEDCLQMLKRAPDVVRYHGSVSFSKAYDALAAADLALALDAEMENTLCKSFLSCKITDFLALRKPMFIITPDGSEHQRICREGYGWFAAPSRPQEIAQVLAKLIEDRAVLRSTAPKAPPEFYKPENVAQTLFTQMQQLVREGKK